MHVIPVNNYINPSFKADKKQYYIAKKAFYASLNEEAEKKASTIAQKAMGISGAALAAITSLRTDKTPLKPEEITYCKNEDGKLSIAFGYNGGFFSVKSNLKFNEEELKICLASSLVRAPLLYGGLINYRNLIKDVKRQDIVEKGLKIHTCELNRDISAEQQKNLAAYFTKVSKKHVEPQDMFYVQDEAFFYDQDEKTVYSLNAMTDIWATSLPTLRKCKFITDDQGNAIGYKVTAMDLFQHRPLETTFIEQQTKTEELPRIADSVNNKLFAEAFRFGNMETPSMRQQNGVENALNHLSKRVGVKNPKQEQLQFVKLYDDKKNILYRINYYDSTIGRSLVYNEDGRYMCQMEYNRDDFGIIRACTKFRLS